MKRLAAATVLVAATATVPAVITPATAADAGLRVVHAGPNSSAGGYPTTMWGTHGVFVAFEDTTPVPKHEYVVSVTAVGAASPTATAAYDAYAGWDGKDAVAYVGDGDDFTLDTDYTVTVEQRQGGEVVDSATLDFRYEAVGHPSRGVLRAKQAGGKRTVKAGTVVRIRWTGSWEPGTQLTQVVAAATKKGISERDYLVCEGSWCPSRKAGQPKWVEHGTEPVTRFRVPKRFAGKKLVVVSYGQLNGEHGPLKAMWGWEWTRRVKRG